MKQPAPKCTAPTLTPMQRFIQEEADLHARKSADYSGGKDPLGNFKRVSAIFALYPGLTPTDPRFVAIAYMMKQFDAYLFNVSNGHELKVEGVHERLKDVSIYAKLLRAIEEEMTTS